MILLKFLFTWENVFRFESKACLCREEVSSWGFPLCIPTTAGLPSSPTSFRGRTSPSPCRTHYEVCTGGVGRGPWAWAALEKETWPENQHLPAPSASYILENHPQATCTERKHLFSTSNRPLFLRNKHTYSCKTYKVVHEQLFWGCFEIS